MADHVEASATTMALVSERIPGTMGFGDALVVRSASASGQDHKGMLILAHLDTVQAMGSINIDLPVRQDGDSSTGQASTT